MAFIARRKLCHHQAGADEEGAVKIDSKLEINLETIFHNLRSKVPSKRRSRAYFASLTVPGIKEVTGASTLLFFLPSFLFHTHVFLCMTSPLMYVTV